MSKIPTPQVVAEGRLPSVAEKRAFAEEVMARFSTEQVKLVFYGSIIRGDATVRSDIDICATPPIDKYINFDGREVERWAEKEIARRGWDTSLSVLNCASKRGDAEHNRVRFSNPSDPDEARFSITTFDHFGYLAKDGRFPSETRQLYAAIQRDIRQYTGSNKEARLRDLAYYVRRSRNYPGSILLSVRWRIWLEGLEHLGWAENVAFHLLRKLAGITKTLKGTDGKAVLVGCFDPRMPFFGEVLGHFAVIKQFGLDIEDVLTHALGRPDHIGEYETFLDKRLTVMAEAALAILNLLHREIKEKTLLETISSYDREKAKTVLVAEGFDEWFARRRELGVVLAVHWWCAGERVYVSIPYEAYVNYRGEVLPHGDSPHWWGKEPRKEYITAEGRVEIGFGPHPRPDRPYIYARPTRSDRSDYQQAARLAHEAVMAKLREILPADIITPSP